MNTERALGALYGALVGDALGVTYEFQPEATLRESLGTMPLEVIGGGPFDFPAGVGSDDTDLMLCALRSYTPRGNLFDKDSMVKELITWLKTNPPDVGNTTAQSIYRWAQGMMPRADETAQGNGGIMRAMAHSLMAPNVIQSGTFAYDDTRLTHNSHLAGTYSAMYATVLRRIIDGRQDGAVMQNIADKGYAFMRGKDGGHCVHTYRLAIGAWREAPDFETGLTEVIKTGGDTDTNAIVAGALLGAKHGYEAIPRRWIDALNRKTATEAEVIVTERWHKKQ